MQVEFRYFLSFMIAIFLFIIIKIFVPVQLFFPKLSYPSLHRQLYEPWVLMQVAFEWQVKFPLEHSSMSEIVKMLWIQPWLLHLLKYELVEQVTVTDG